MEDYYQEKLKEIKSIMGTDPHKAFMEVSNELNMPYVPSVYEGEFVKLHNELKVILKEEVTAKKLSNEDILEYLWSEDTTKRIMAVENLKNSNLRDFKEDVAKWIEQQDASHNITKAFLYELLADQEINIEITIDGVVLNPAIDKSLFDNNEFKKGLIKVQELTRNEPSLEKMLLEEYERFFLMTFPKKHKDGEALAISILNIIKKMMDDKVVLSTEDEAVASILNNVV